MVEVERGEFDDDDDDDLDPATVFIDTLSLNGLSQEIETDLFDYEDDDVDVTALAGKFNELFENIDNYFDNPIDGILEQMVELNSELLTILRLRTETLDQYRHMLRVKSKALTELADHNRELERIPKWIVRMVTTLSSWKDARRKSR